MEFVFQEVVLVHYLVAHDLFIDFGIALCTTEEPNNLVVAYGTTVELSFMFFGTKEYVLWNYNGQMLTDAFGT